MTARTRLPIEEKCDRRASDTTIFLVIGDCHRAIMKTWQYDIMDSSKDTRVMSKK